MIPIKVLVPSGVLGLGFDLEALNNGVKKTQTLLVLTEVLQIAVHIL